MGLNWGFAGNLFPVSLGYQTGPHAPGTDINPSHSPFLYSLNPLEIGPPYLFGPVVGVADIVAYLSSFEASRFYS
jgi:hypothetical protein